MDALCIIGLCIALLAMRVYIAHLEQRVTELEAERLRRASRGE